MISKFLQLLANTTDEGIRRINSIMQITLVLFILVSAVIGLIGYGIETITQASAGPDATARIEIASPEVAEAGARNDAIPSTPVDVDATVGSQYTVDTYDEADNPVSYTPCRYVESGDIFLTEDEVYTLSTLVFLEASTESYFAKKCVASVVLNRMYTSGQSLDDIVYATNQFEPAEYIPYYEPTEECIDAVHEVLADRATVPIWVQYFRTDYYHNWSDQIQPFIQIDNTYFSYDIEIMEQYKGGA